MSVTLITTPQELTALEAEWNALATSPFQTYEWLVGWWNYYGEARRRQTDRNGKEGLESAAENHGERQLHVLAVYEDEIRSGESRLLGIAPWFLDRTIVKGNILRWLGSGEVCTDHSSLLCRAGYRDQVAAAVADALTTRCGEWDQLDLKAVDADDQAILLVLRELEQRGCIVSGQSADSCWVLDLPSSWDDYLANVSKSHRKQLRQLERRVIDSGRVQWHQVATLAEFDVAWPILVDLHQRRRRSLGDPGCFASKPFHDFHRTVAPKLLERGQLRLSWLELDGRPAAAEYHLAGAAATYAYQGGVDPDRLEVEPGRLSTILCLRGAIDEGHRKFDFLRGDEPYKAHWRAQPRATNDYRVIPNRRLARLRGRVLNLTGTVSDWLRTSVQQLTE